MPFDFEKNLTEKLGPLPGYAWVLLGVGGVYWYRKKRPSMSVTSTNAAAPIATSTDSAGAYDPNAANNNAQWGSKAAQNLYSSSAYSPSDITDAINAYLNGSSLTSNQQGIIAAAVAGLGNPPDNFGIDSSQTDSITAISNQATITASQEAINAATAYADVLASTADLGYQPDITPGYNNPSGFSGTAANDGANGTGLGSPTIPSISTNFNNGTMSRPGDNLNSIIPSSNPPVDIRPGTILSRVS